MSSIQGLAAVIIGKCRVHNIACINSRAIEYDRLWYSEIVLIVNKVLIASRNI